MAEEKPREIELYTCNKYVIRMKDEEITLCNNPAFCDAETKQRRRCSRVRVIIVPSESS